METNDDSNERCVVLFDNDNSVWEWFENETRCSKILEETPMIAPNWFEEMNYTNISDILNPYTNETKKCFYYNY